MALSAFSSIRLGSVTEVLLSVHRGKKSNNIKMLTQTAASRLDRRQVGIMARGRPQRVGLATGGVAPAVTQRNDFFRAQAACLD
jgi:hypothetical protein